MPGVSEATRTALPRSRLRIPDTETLDDATRNLRARHHEENWIQALSLNPGTARRFTGYFEDLFATGQHRLPLADRELIAVVVSVANGCGVCTAHHTHALGQVLDDPARAKRIALDHHLVNLSAREQAIAALALKVTTAPKTITAGDLHALSEHGLSEQQALEVLETSAWFNHTNRLTIALGVLPDDKFFN
ncbi:peroxidase-related enzyme [Pseudomonas typographi]|uniref:Peroxidase-related enzyme n=1 Tax=Pseudomonas typographi TaxID=2715964 RepID=A0ABR7YWT0_9PSED|nr:peroxidase-related enzyme [Pseudomonas typographi]MBD1597642.1 peroxidase-related enzyme [Pseudomonas typographi]